MPDHQESIESTDGSMIDMDEVITSLSTSEDDLFARLVPAAEQDELYSFDGLVARGREIFKATFRRVQDTVCPIYRMQEATLGDEVQLVALIAGSIVGQLALAGIPAVPMAALAVKIGLSRLCPPEVVDG
jgi:hypothetical protein